MQPQDPVQPQPPIQPTSIPPQPIYQPQPVAQPQTGMPMQPQVPTPPPTYQSGPIMSANSFKGSGSSKSKLLRIGLGVVIAFVAGGGATFLLGNKTPSYSKLKSETTSGYTYKTFEGWTKKDIGTDGKTVRYEDYIDSAKKEEGNNLYAQQIVSIETDVIPVTELTAENKLKLKTELNKTDGNFFTSLKQSFNECSTLDNKKIQVSDNPSIKNAFILADFSFDCTRSSDKLVIKATGRIVFSNNGTAATTAVVATGKVFDKNQKIFEESVQSISAQ